MSIVERALQKAQQQAQDRASAAGPAETAQQPSGEPEAAATPPPPPTPRFSRTTDEGSVTARDLKAIVQFDVELLRAAGRLPSADTARQTDEEMRRVKWPLLNAITGRSGSAPTRNNVIMVTSAEPAEGKTFTSLNLALSIVRDRELRVILVDGDVARPGLTPTLGLEGRKGLNDVLEDESLDVSTVTYQTDVEGMFFVPAGKWHDQAPEFFAGSRMEQVVGALSRRVGNGVVVLDSPPLLATNEAQAVTRYVGQVLLVVRADHTEQRAVLDALALVDKSTPVSAVLNLVEQSMMSKYYGQYYYGHSYSQGRTTGKGDA